ncbi:hypothetical protein T492DRAFT_834196 [Pavlovales sp. CCMP2436]|nr:hypothetical protein T492DRAFT_834196 [Pavlovales sp. CCMP2436]
MPAPPTFGASALAGDAGTRGVAANGAPAEKSPRGVCPAPTAEGNNAPPFPLAATGARGGLGGGLGGGAPEGAAGAVSMTNVHYKRKEEKKKKNDKKKNKEKNKKKKEKKKKETAL